MGKYVILSITRQLKQPSRPEAKHRQTEPEMVASLESADGPTLRRPVT